MAAAPQNYTIFSEESTENIENDNSSALVVDREANVSKCLKSSDKQRSGHSNTTDSDITHRESQKKQGFQDKAKTSKIAGSEWNNLSNDIDIVSDRKAREENEVLTYRERNATSFLVDDFPNTPISDETTEKNAAASAIYKGAKTLSFFESETMKLKPDSNLGKNSNSDEYNIKPDETQPKSIYNDKKIKT